MIKAQFPTPRHSSVLAEVLDELRADANVLGVMLGGSLARRTARRDSDIDLIVVQAHGDRRADRQSYGPIVVERVVRTPEAWMEQFTPTRVGDESWGYAFLDGVILHDPSGVVAELVDAAGRAHAAYRVPEAIKDHFAWFWSHVRPKMEAVLKSKDATEVGWSSAVMTHPVIQSVWAINERPLPSLDLGCLHRHLDDLTVPLDAPALIREMLHAPPQLSLQLQLRILDVVVPRLQSREPS